MLSQKVELLEWQFLSFFLSCLTGGQNPGAVHSCHLLISTWLPELCNWCSCLTVLITLEHHRPLQGSPCSDTLPNPSLCADWWVPSWGPRKEQGSSSAKKPRGLSPFLEPKDVADASPTGGLSLLQFYLVVVSHPCVTQWGRGCWCLLSFPLSCEKLSPHKLRRIITHCQHG